MAADVLQAFAAQRGQAVAARFRDFNYWRTDEQERQAREQLEVQRRSIDEEMTGALRELLGTDATPPPTDHQWRQAAWEQQLGFLPEEKRQKTVGLLFQNVEVDDRIRALADGRRTPESAEERQHVLAAYDVRRQEMTALLTPEEYLQVELAMSWTEFRAVFREWRAHDESLARLYATGQPDPGNDLVFAKIREALGDKRYEEYRSTWWK
ncbi:MAG: hypothetical protein DME25_19505 [Verrucomicrobia bacterium]|nr:MAG: hypothetical protein DME25_19505 [Verrucomicrobiota bacterium]